MALPSANTSDEREFYGRYFYILRGREFELARMGAVFVFASFLDLVGVGLVGPFVGAVASQNKLNSYAFVAKAGAILGLPLNGLLLAFGVFLVAFYIVKAVIAHAVQQRILNFSFGFRADLIRRLMDAYLWMPYRYFLQRNSAAIVQSVTEHTKTMVDNLLIPSLKLVSDVTVLVLVFSFLLWLNWPAVLLAGAVLGGAFLLYSQTVRPRVRLVGEKVGVAHEQLIRNANQAIWSIKEIRTLGMEKPFFDAVSQAADRNAKAMTSFNVMLGVPRYSMEAVVVIIVILLAEFVLLQGKSSNALVPMLAMFAAAGLRILPALTQVSSSIASINYCKYSLDEVYEDLRFLETNALDRHAERDRETHNPRFRTLALKNVGYRYDNATGLALDDVSFSLTPGKSIGLIGQTGSGKTTLVDLLLGFHEATTGQILIDGRDVREYGWDNWRRQIAYIPQNVAMIDDTIEANIAFGTVITPEARERLDQAVRDAQLAAMVARLPAGLQTNIGERGIRLSGGERQRIALARGFFFDRSVFILDEATSALDNETERQVIEVIEGLRGQKTLIVIAHRLTTVKNCEVVYRLQNGRIVNSGSFDEVVRDVAVA